MAQMAETAVEVFELEEDLTGEKSDDCGEDTNWPDPGLWFAQNLPK